MRAALARVDGSFAVAAISELEPDTLVAARRFSPLVVGVGPDGTHVASDAAALLAHTREILFIEDDELVVLTRDGVRITTLKGAAVMRATRHIDWSPTMAEKGGHKHFMLKEILEQPRALSDTLRSRISLARGEVTFDTLDLAGLAPRISRVVFVACGTSYHAALTGRLWIESLSRLPAEVEVASEYRMRAPLLDERTLVVAVSQSGETADTLAALRLAKAHGAPTLSICNVIESSLARLADSVLYTHAGPEISVASTKAFTTQLALLYLLAVGLGRARNTLSERDAAHKLLELVRVPVLQEEWLAAEGPRLCEMAEQT